MTESPSRLPADNPTVLLGVVTIVSGVATGLFADLRLLGQIVGLLAFAAWVVAIGLILWGPESRLQARSTARVAFVATTVVAFSLTALLLVYAFVTGPRLSPRTLVLTPSGLGVIAQACPGAGHGSEVAADVALNQLGDQFVQLSSPSQVVTEPTQTFESDLKICERCFQHPRFGERPRTV